MTQKIHITEAARVTTNSNSKYSCRSCGWCPARGWDQEGRHASTPHTASRLPEDTAFSLPLLWSLLGLDSSSGGVTDGASLMSPAQQVRPPGCFLLKHSLSSSLSIPLLSIFPGLFSSPVPVCAIDGCRPDPPQTPHRWMATAWGCSPQGH